MSSRGVGDRGRGRQVHEPATSRLRRGLIVWTLCQSALAVDVAARVNGAYPVGQKVEFAANAVGEGDLSFTWDFGDGAKSKVSDSGTVTHVYDEPGHYPVIVVARDDVGARSVKQHRVETGSTTYRNLET